jgi:hypothetical protein
MQGTGLQLSEMMVKLNNVIGYFRETTLTFFLCYANLKGGKPRCGGVYSLQEES